MSKHVYVACARMKYPTRQLTVVASATEKGVTSWARGALLTLSLLHKTEPTYYDVEGFILSATVASSAVWVKKVEFISSEWPDEEEDGLLGPSPLEAAYEAKRIADTVGAMFAEVVFDGGKAEHGGQGAHEPVHDGTGSVPGGGISATGSAGTGEVTG